MVRAHRGQAHRSTASRLLCLAFLVLFAATAPRDAVAQGPISVPERHMLVLLVRATMVALNHANFTVNYTVLRDLGAPAFRNANTSARLAVASMAESLSQGGVSD